LMDQMASSVGSAVSIDFADPSDPIIKQVTFDFAKTGHYLCIVDSGADHADLTDEYAAITIELKNISRHFGKEVLRDIDEADFYAAIPELREKYGDRAILRAIHFYAENKRAIAEAEALANDDFETFLKLSRESGASSYMYLQNVYCSGAVKEQAVSLALALSDQILGNRGTFRVHGGGFAGTIQAFVPADLLETYRTTMENVLGKDSCHVLSIRPEGGIVLLA
ncbi:MAG: galactokinase, partial [Firmicutes bacterium]|nr:galactokinase [Bacillota bacterium]